MESMESSSPPAAQEDPVTSCSITRGGPLFVPNLVGPLTRVPNFESSLLLLLQDLEAEISSGLVNSCNDDISVDELKVFSEEELVDMAMKEAFKDGEVDDSYSQLLENQSIAGEEHRQGVSNGDLSPVENSACKKDGSTALQCIDESASKDNVKRRKRKTKNSQAVSYITKVEEVVKIKQKQEDEKATSAARLHSFNAIHKTSEGAIASADRAEKLEIMRSTGSKVKLKPSIVQEHMPVQYPEVVLSVEVYHHSRKNKVQEFLVLGHQVLTELRDKIYCITDQIMEKAGLYDPSGYFLIEDIFCNDLRDPSAIDYSKPIVQWLNSSKDEALQKWEYIVSGELQQKQKAVVGEVSNLQLPQFKAVEMQKTHLWDLKFQLGAGYLYCHQGDCKHSIVIRDMRQIHPDDVQIRAAYPITTFQLKTRWMKCLVCNIYRATKVTLDDKWATENPCYFCDNCYFLLHYSKDRSLLYDDFSVFDYHPD